jgi:hypothetical protein
MGVVNALIKGAIEDQERLRTSGGSLLSDELLTMLCGLILGLVLQVQVTT